MSTCSVFPVLVLYVATCLSCSSAPQLPCGGSSNQDPRDLCSSQPVSTSNCDIVADPSDCTRFYSCAPSPGGGFTPHHLSCYHGLAFNEDLYECGACDHRQNVERCNCMSGAWELLKQ